MSARIVIAAIAAIAISFLIRQSITSQLHRFSQFAERVGRGDLAERAGEPRTRHVDVERGGEAIRPGEEVALRDEGVIEDGDGVLPSLGRALRCAAFLLACERTEAGGHGQRASHDGV